MNQQVTLAINSRRNRAAVEEERWTAAQTTLFVAVSSSTLWLGIVTMAMAVL